MLRAIETAMAGYADRSADLARAAGRIAKQDADPVDDMVGLMVNQHAAEADLAVARVADDATETLIHVIA